MNNELDLFDADMRDCLGPVMGFCSNCQRPVFAAEYNETWDNFEMCDDCFENWGDPDEWGEDIGSEVHKQCEDQMTPEQFQREYQGIFLAESPAPSDGRS